MTPRFDPSLLPKIPHLRHENALWVNGALWIAGIDEAGRGALAGPVSAAAVILPKLSNIAQDLAGVRDSKKMSPIQRETWKAVIKETAVTYGVGLASAQEIDSLGIISATRMAAARAIKDLAIGPDWLLLDYLHLPDIPILQISLIKGDMRSLSIAAASVLAKTTRDAILIQLDNQYPGYGFVNHKGYGTKSHLEAIKRLGPSPIHRMSFAPIRTLAQHSKS
jgi:ribonuclease HII